MFKSLVNICQLLSNICQLLDISPKKFIFLNIFDSGSSDNDVLLTDQNSNAPEIGDKINTILVIN